MKNMKGTESDETRVRRINVVDVALIAVLLCIVLVAVEYFTSFSFLGLGGSTRTIEYTLEFENVDPDMAASVNVGDHAIGLAGYRAVGEVRTTDTSAAVKYVYNPALGSIVARELPANAQNKTPLTLRVTLRTEATYRAGDGFSVNGNRISVGDSLAVSFDGFSGTGRCVSIYSVG